MFNRKCYVIFTHKNNGYIVRKLLHFIMKTFKLGKYIKYILDYITDTLTRQF